MATNTIAYPHEYPERITAKLILSGALAETITAVGILVLTIIGLTGFMPMAMLSIATIGLGISFLFEGGTVASKLSDLLSEVTEGRIDIAELGGGLGAEFVGGLGGITFGILSLVGVVPMILTATAAIVYGGTLILGAGVKVRLNHLSISKEEHLMAREIARQAVMASSGIQILVGLGAVVLGILALIQIHPLELTLVAILSVAGIMMLSSTAMGVRILTLFRR